MEKNNETNESHSIGDRLTALRPSVEWQPSLTRGLALLREQRKAQHGRRHRWAWVAAGAAAISLLLVAFPATRGLAERYASACVNLFGKLSGSEPSLS